MNIYTFSLERNKGHKGYLREKKEIISNNCIKCGTNSNIELEHIIPVTLGGAIFNKKNLQAMCKKCHLEKTLKDKKVISILKTINIIQDKSKHSGRLLLHPKEVKEIYLFLFNKIQDKFSFNIKNEYFIIKEEEKTHI